MTNENTQEVKEEIRKDLSWIKKETLKIDDNQINDFVNEFLANPQQRFFFTGKGKSGLVAKAVAMRVGHLGFDARVIGETTTPPVQNGNLFILVSRGGEHQIKELREAIQLGAKILVVTARPESTAARLADKVLILPGKREENIPSSYRERRVKKMPVFLLGEAFETTAFVVLNAVMSQIAVILGLTEKDLEKRHAKPE